MQGREIIKCFLSAILLAGCDDKSPTNPDLKDGAVAGLVMASDSGVPIEGAIITMQPGAHVDTTDILGLYVLPAINPGNYNVTATRAGFHDTTINVVVNSGGSSTIHFKLLFNPPTLGLVAYYPLDGNANDYSGNGHNGSIYAASLTADRFGRADKAYYFDGNTFIDIGTSAELNLTKELSFTAWIKDSGGSGIKNVVARWDTQIGVNERAYGLGLRNNNLGYLIISKDGMASGAVAIEDANPLEQNKWYFLAATYDNTVMRLYKNGIEVASGAQSGMGLSPNTRSAIGATIGRLGDNYASTFRGSIDALRVYNRPLSKEEILILYDEK